MVVKERNTRVYQWASFNAVIIETPTGSLIYGHTVIASSSLFFGLSSEVGQKLTKRPCWTTVVIDLRHTASEPLSVMYRKWKGMTVGINARLWNTNWWFRPVKQKIQKFCVPLTFPFSRSSFGSKKMWSMSHNRYDCLKSSNYRYGAD